MSDQVSVQRKGGKIWSHLRNKWLEETPEETVRQEYLVATLIKEYGFTLEQMAEELEVTGRGSGHARADFVIWRSERDKISSNSPLIIVECKSDNVTIAAHDYAQGDNYARLTGGHERINRTKRCIDGF
ncbi:type I restriction enzyme HsdR N-terminal domain-containing protein [Bradyrhizobium sp. USDA 4473]